MYHCHKLLDLIDSAYHLLLLLPCLANVNPEDGGEMFLRNVGLPPNYTSLQLFIIFFDFFMNVFSICRFKVF
jgi:hypothetical protein